MNGVAQSDDLDVKSPFLRIGGAGCFDIGRGRIDYTARVTVIDSALGQGGAGLDALRGVTVPVALSGPFDAIDWQIQWSGGCRGGGSEQDQGQARRNAWRQARTSTGARGRSGGAAVQGRAQRQTPRVVQVTSADEPANLRIGACRLPRC